MECLEKTKKNKQNEQSLERILELTKRFYVEQKMNQISQKLDKLATKEEQLSKETNEENTSKKQDEINKEFNCFEEIRSSGLWLGCKLNVKENFNLDTIMKGCYAEGLMILKANNNTIRIAPSLIIEDRLILKGLKILRSVIQGQLRPQ